MRFLLAAHGARLAFDRVEQPRFLIDRAAVLDDIDLATRLHLDRLADEADGVDVLNLAARPEFVAGLAHRDIHVSAQVALLHVGVGRSQITQDGAQLGDVCLRLLS